MQLTYDLTTQRFSTTGGISRLLSKLSLNRGDTPTIIVTLTDNGASTSSALTALNGASAVLGIKANGAYGSGFLAASPSPTTSTTISVSSNTVTFPLNLNTTQIASAFTINGSSVQPPTLVCMMQIQFTKGSSVTSTSSLEVDLNNDVISGTEGPLSSVTNSLAVSATASALSAGSNPSASASVSGTLSNPQVSFAFGIPNAANNTLSIGTVGTNPGGNATASVSGTSPNQTLNLGLPANSLSIGAISTNVGTPATASISGTAPTQTLNLGLPATQLSLGTVATNVGTAATASLSGNAPAQTLSLGLPATQLSIGTVGTNPGAAATASISGNAPAQTLNLGLPATTLGIGTVGTNPGGNATASITGTAPTQTLNLGLPANSLSIAAVNTLAAGSQATASIGGTAPNQTLTLGIPIGATGATGAVIPPATTAPLANAATASVGTSTNYARADHVHPATGVFSVAGKTGTVSLTHSDITDFNSSVTALAAVTSVNGQTGNVTIPTGVLSVTSGATTQTGAVTLGSMASLDEEDVYNYLANQYDPIGSAANAASASVPLNTKGAANGVASLDGGGKVPVAQLPSTLMRYIGTWNATTNTPTLSNGTGVSGNVYNVSVAGTSLGYTWNVGDWAIYNGSKWEQSPGSDEVVSVAGKTGIVTLDTSNISENSSYLYFTAARAIAAVTWSTLTGIPSWIASVTTFAQSLLTSASAAAARTVLGLGSISTFLGDQNLRVADQPSFCGGTVSFGSGGSASFADEGFIINSDGEITGNFSVDANGAATFSQGAINLNANGSANFANSNVVIAANGAISAKSLTLTTPLPATSVSGVVTTSTTAGQQINKIVTMSQAAYNALGTYSSTTLYVIVGS